LANLGASLPDVVDDDNNDNNNDNDNEEECGK